MPYGHDASFLLVPSTESFIIDYVTEHCDGKFPGLRMQLNTTLGTFSVPLSSEILEHLQNVGANKSSQGTQQNL